MNSGNSGAFSNEFKNNQIHGKAHEELLSVFLRNHCVLLIVMQRYSLFAIPTENDKFGNQ